MGAGSVTSKQEGTSVQMGIPVQVRIRNQTTQTQSSASRERTTTKSSHPLIMTTLHYLLGVVAANALELEQMDVKMTFLLENLLGDIYMSQSAGFTATGGDHLVCRLKKSL